MLENLDLALLAIDEIIDRGCVISTVCLYCWPEHCVL